MSKKEKDIAEEGIVTVEETLSKAERFIENNQKKLAIIVGIIAGIIAIYVGYNKFYIDPLEEEAQSQIFVAEQYMEKDSLELALYGDGNYLGFIDIADEYGLTKTGKMANYYLGVIYFKKGEYETALEHLDDFTTDDEVLQTVAIGLKGDINVELEKYDDAISYYKKASERNPNKLVTPIYLLKLGLIYEELGEYKNAVDVYDNLKTKYNKTIEGRQAIKLHARANALMNK